MGEWVYTEIKIGGTVSAKVAEELREMLDGEFDSSTVDIVGGALYAGGERNYGNADEVESFCQEHGLSYVLTWSAAAGCFDSGSHAWRPGMEEAAEFSAGDSGDPSYTLGEMKAALAKGQTLADIIAELSIGDAATLPPYVEEAAPAEGQEEGGEEPDTAEASLTAAAPAMLAVMQRAAGCPGAMADLARAGIWDDFQAALAAAEGREG